MRCKGEVHLSLSLVCYHPQLSAFASLTSYLDFNNLDLRLHLLFLSHQSLPSMLNLLLSDGV
jgi:hypothetical protein